MPTFPLPDRHRELDEHHHRQRQRIERETATIIVVITTTATNAGDESKLRGVPVIADGVPGHIPGSRP